MEKARCEIDLSPWRRMRLFQRSQARLALSRATPRKDATGVRTRNDLPYREMVGAARGAKNCGLVSPTIASVDH